MPPWFLDVTQFYHLDIPHAPAKHKIYKTALGTGALLVSWQYGKEN